MSPASRDPRPWVLLGNPENRRVTMFQAALARAGRPIATVLPWRDVVGDADAFGARLDEVAPGPALVRIDSFGEDFELERELLALGHADALALGAETVDPDAARSLTFDRGRILAPRQQHCGFLRVLDRVEAALAARPHLVARPHPETIRRLFDKRACADQFAKLGVPIPPPLRASPPASPRELRERLRERGIDEAFVKLSCGSSASCLALYGGVTRGAEWLFTSMEIDGDRLYNSLRPRRYQDPRAIERLLAYLIGEGSHVEAHVRKARIGAQWFDTRMLVVAGAVAFTIVRKSGHPVTNLHLGGARGTEAELALAVTPDAIDAAHASCRAIFDAERAWHVGVDVAFPQARGGGPADAHVVIEANAFGDLFPNLTREGLSVYEWEVHAIEASADAAAER